jgi:hypothetical protein
MRRAFLLAVVAATVTAMSLVAQQPAKQIEYDKRAPVVPLLEDDAHKLIPHLTNDFDGSQQASNAASEDADVYSGGSALRVTPLQRHSRQILGWTWRIVEKPTAAGEYRYIRFAWKKAGGEGIAVQLHDQARTWIVRYHAGKNVLNWQPSIGVADAIPKEWTVVTRDLWADNGKQPMTLTGMAFTAFDGQHGLFDHVMLGRTVADLDEASDAALGRTKPGYSLDPKYREALWEDLFEKDREKASVAVRGLLGDAKGVAPLLADRLPQTTQSPEEVKDRAKRIGTYITQLGGDTDFDTRLAAEEGLAKIGAPAEPSIRSALTSADPEVRYRANRLMRNLKLEEGESPVAARVAARMTRILERAGTDESKALLKKMSDGVYGPDYLDPAAAALARMK